MGSIAKFDLQRVISDFNTRVFFETGTWKGDGVAYALEFPFEKIISVEIVPGIAAQAVERFAGESRVEIFEGSSQDILKKELQGIRQNCLFWLDAHYPGADEGIEEYNADMDEELRLPLENELKVIRDLRGKRQDVIIIDDLRIYENGPYEKGNAPSDTLPKRSRDLDFIEKEFSDTHHINRSYLDEGYLILLPKSETSLNEGLAGDYIHNTI